MSRTTARTALTCLVAAAALVAAAVVTPLGADAAPSPTSTSTSGKGGPLTPRLAALATSRVQGMAPALRARSLAVAASGPGSLATDGLGRYLVDIRVSDTARSTLDALRVAGATVQRVDAAGHRVYAAVPAGRLTALADVQPQVLSVAETLRPATSGVCPTGIVSEGDTQLKAALARTHHAVDGSGITVGIISDSYDHLGGASSDVTNAELPGTTNPCGFTTAVSAMPDGTGGEDEGRAMAQIVHDLAPGAKILFATDGPYETDFAQHIRDLAAAGADVIVDDITYYDEPMYQDGIVGKAVDDVVAAGVTYFSSAGNSTVFVGGRLGSSYESMAYRPTACPATVSAYDPGIKDCHNFSTTGTDPTYGIAWNGDVTELLGWDEPEYGVTTDLDLYILDSTGAVVAYSNDQNSGSTGTQRAFEFIGDETGAGNYSIVIARYGAADTGTPRLKLIHYRSATTALEYDHSVGTDVVGPTIFGHNASRAGATVAAVPYDSSSEIESYSSRGPATYCFGPVDGSTPAAPLTPCQTADVDLSATDGAANSFFGQQVAGTWRFYGTSAAAPHAAAVAALIRQQRPCLTPAQVLAAMKATAVPVSTYGVHDEGAGLVDADIALTRAGTGACAPPHVAVGFPAAPASGWRTTSPVTGTVTATDPDTVTAIACTGATVGTLTGRGTTSAHAPITVTGDGTHAVSCSATDGLATSGADPSSTRTATVKLDATAPAVTLSGPAVGATYVYGAVPVARCTTTDAASGVAASATLTVAGGTNGAGAFTASCAGARDTAGNTRATVARAYRVVYGFGGYSAPRSGASVKRGTKLTATFALTSAAGSHVADAWAARLGTRKAVVVTLRTKSSGGTVRATAVCRYVTASHRFSCVVTLSSKLAAGTYWLEARENTGFGAVHAPAVKGARSANALRITVRR